MNLLEGDPRGIVDLIRVKVVKNRRKKKKRDDEADAAAIQQQQSRTWTERPEGMRRRDLV